jgi:putative sterol carrier protein
MTVERKQRTQGDGVTTTGDSVTAFFEDLGGREYEPVLRNVSGTVRFDLVSGKTTERWLVAMRKGNLAVSRRNVAADAVIRMDRRFFEALVEGETNLFAAMLRGEVEIDGDYGLMIILRRLVRKRMAVRQPERAAGYTRRQR